MLGAWHQPHEGARRDVSAPGVQQAAGMWHARCAWAGTIQLLIADAGALLASACRLSMGLIATALLQ